MIRVKALLHYQLNLYNLIACPNMAATFILDILVCRPSVCELHWGRFIVLGHQRTMATGSGGRQMDVDKCVTVIMSIWWLNPAPNSTERQHKPNKTSKRNRAGSKAEWAVLWVLQKSKEVEADGSLLPTSYWELQMVVFSWFVSSDSAIMIASVTSHQREQRELFNMLNCKMYSSSSKALKECCVTPVYPALPVSYQVYPGSNVHSVPMWRH